MRVRRGVIAVVAGVAAVAVAIAAVVMFSMRTSLPRQVTYRGLMYMGVVEMTQREVGARFGRFRADGGRIGGRPVFRSSERVPELVALLQPDRHFAIYQRMR